MIVVESSAERFQSVLCNKQRIDDTIQTWTRRREWSVRTGSDVPRLRLSLMKLSLQVRLSDFDIQSGHVRRLMPEQLHHGGEGHAGAKHLSGICVPHPVWDDAARNADSVTDLVQVIA